MEVAQRVENVVSSLDGIALFNKQLGHSYDDLHNKTSTGSLRSDLTGSFGIDASRVVELDLSSYEDDDSEDEGEIMLLAMILLQLHGVKFPGGFPEDTEDQHNKKKRQRTSPDQLAILETIFQTDKMPSQQTRVQLADQLGMSSRRVQIWFQNKRAKVKRGQMKSEGGQAPMSPLQDSRDFNCLSSSSGVSEPPSPVADGFHVSPATPPHTQSLFSSSSSLQSSPPSSPATVPSSPSPHLLSSSSSLTSSSLMNKQPHHSSQPTSQLQFSLSSLSAAQPILLPSEFSAMSAC